MSSLTVLCRWFCFGFFFFKQMLEEPSETTKGCLHSTWLLVVEQTQRKPAVMWSGASTHELFNRSDKQEQYRNPQDEALFFSDWDTQLQKTRAKMYLKLFLILLWTPGCVSGIEPSVIRRSYAGRRPEQISLMDSWVGWPSACSSMPAVALWWLIGWGWLKGETGSAAALFWSGLYP